MLKFCHIGKLGWWGIAEAGLNNRGKLDHYPSLKITMEMDGHHEWGGRIIDDKMQTTRN